MAKSGIQKGSVWLPELWVLTMIKFYMKPEFPASLGKSEDLETLGWHPGKKTVLCFCIAATSFMWAFAPSVRVLSTHDCITGLPAYLLTVSICVCRLERQMILQPVFECWKVLKNYCFFHFYLLKFRFSLHYHNLFCMFSNYSDDWNTF